MAKKKGRLSWKYQVVITIGLVAAVILAAFLIFSNVKKRQDSKILSAQNATSDSTVNMKDETQESTSETGTEGIYIIKGNDKSSNKYERADKLCYTDTIKYTQEDIEQLDAYGLKVTRNEVYARHGRMFTDQELQNYFNRQSWYVATVSPEKFDDEILNDVENYNINLIVQYEMQY